MVIDIPIANVWDRRVNKTCDMRIGPLEVTLHKHVNVKSLKDAIEQQASQNFTFLGYGVPENLRQQIEDWFHKTRIV